MFIRIWYGKKSFRTFTKSSKVISALFLCFSRHLGLGSSVWRLQRLRSNCQRGRYRDSERQVEPESRGNKQEGFVLLEPSTAGVRAHSHARMQAVLCDSACWIMLTAHRRDGATQLRGTESSGSESTRCWECVRGKKKKDISVCVLLLMCGCWARCQIIIPAISVIHANQHFEEDWQYSRSAQWWTGTGEQAAVLRMAEFSLVQFSRVYFKYINYFNNS